MHRIAGWPGDASSQLIAWRHTCGDDNDDDNDDDDATHHHHRASPRAAETMDQSVPDAAMKAKMHLEDNAFCAVWHRALALPWNPATTHRVQCGNVCGARFGASPNQATMP